MQIPGREGNGAALGWMWEHYRHSEYHCQGLRHEPEKMIWGSKRSQSPPTQRFVYHRGQRFWKEQRALRGTVKVLSTLMPPRTLIWVHLIRWIPRGGDAQICVQERRGWPSHIWLGNSISEVTFEPGLKNEHLPGRRASGKTINMWEEGCHV